MDDVTPPPECWLPVPGYEGLYEVSDRGRIWSVPRQRWTGIGWAAAGGIVLRQSPDRDGYMQVGLSAQNRNRTRKVHQLVMLAHAGPCPEGQEVLHGPGGKLDNSLPNLSYGTRAENCADKMRDGTSNWGERNGSARLSEADIREIRRMYVSTKHLGRYHPDRWTAVKLSAAFGVGQTTIGAIVRGRSWAHTR